MKLLTEFRVNIQSEEVTEKVKEAHRLGLRDTIAAIQGDAMAMSPKVTGNNMRSIAAEVSGMGMVASGGEGTAERMVDDDQLEAAVYSTSGYGGHLETGTVKRPATPYFRPALDKHSKELVPNIKRHLK